MAVIPLAQALRLYGVGAFVTETATRMSGSGSGAASGSATCCTNVAGSQSCYYRRVLPCRVRGPASPRAARANAAVALHIPPWEVVCRRLVGRRRDRPRSRR